MASTETQPTASRPRPDDDEKATSAAVTTAARETPASGSDLAGLGAGLDALDTHATARPALREVLRRKVLPPVLAVVLVLALWQAAFALGLKPDYQLPSPLMVWDALAEEWYKGTILGVVWQSVSRGALGFGVALVVGTPLGLLVARVRPVRAAIGPILSGLQSLPSVAWVPAAIIWFGLTNATIYAVVLLGAVPSIANGLVAGVDRIDPLHLRAGKVIGARGLRGVRHVLLPAALPGYVAGLKQGWAFSWRSLMAAELIATSPELGVGLGRLLDTGRSYQDMPLVLGAILLILLVGIGIELLVFAPVERRVLRHRGLLR
ncbi:ABC transporter permease [Streptomyces tubbatahanensis]|uniref:ABC transporter permease n=1 Tax=Streptomyces tubbatahanensis TaxID=2923272 RepID=A0ABY3XYF8_9ACTN|nr:ABC transporter permease [Streptomyces tubbatahanensis]UNS99570.1 ABC transporter permease [Streptomyces tubbatahanensis]